MAEVTLNGNLIHTSGDLPEIGEMAKDFILIGTDLSKVSLSDFKGSRVVMNIFPSIDTGTCAASVRRFNEVAASLENTKVLCISRDLPFAQKRFCGAEGLDNVIPLSDYATGAFGRDYGLEFIDGALPQLHSRVVIILNEVGMVTYTQQVDEITQEPDYYDVLANL